VNEIRPGVEPHTSPRKIQRRLPQRTEVEVREADIDRLAFHVETVRCDVSRPPAKLCVRGRGTVAGDDMERRTGTDFPGQGVEKIEQVGVDGCDFSRPVVAQDMIDAQQGLGTIPPLYAIGRIQGFPGVGVEKGERSYGGRETSRNTERGNGGKTRNGGQNTQFEKFTAIDLPTVHNAP